MNKTIFKRRAVATAVSAVITAGMSGVAFAAPITAGPGSTSPTLATVPFVGGSDSSVRVTGTGNTDEEQSATVYYFEEGNATPLGQSLQADDPAGAGMELTATIAVPAGATLAAIIVDAGPNDTIGGDRFAYVNKTTGALVGGFAFEGDALAAAIDAGAGTPGLLSINEGYRRITITDAKVDDTVDTELVYVTFNADPNIVGENLSNGDRLDVKAGLNGKDVVVSDGTPGTPADGLPKPLHLIPVTFAAGANSGKVTRTIRIQTDLGQTERSLTAYAVVLSP